MNSRNPTKAEKIYMQAALSVGCVACRKMGRDTDGTEEFTSFHHNPQKGSAKPLAHFFGFGLCPYHHQGVIPAGCEDPDEPIRHSNEDNMFRDEIGTDIACAAYVWSQLGLDAIDSIGEINNIYSFDDLIEQDHKNRNQS